MSEIREDKEVGGYFFMSWLPTAFAGCGSLSDSTIAEEAFGASFLFYLNLTKWAPVRDVIRGRGDRQQQIKIYKLQNSINIPVNLWDNINAVNKHETVFLSPSMKQLLWSFLNIIFFCLCFYVLPCPTAPWWSTQMLQVTYSHLELKKKLKTIFFLLNT